MTLNAAWSIKGIDAETREKVKVQAKAAGLTMGEWLSDTVNTANNEQHNHTIEPAPSPVRNRTHNTQHSYSNPADQQISGGFSIIENALTDIVGHIELADRNNSTALRNMQTQIANLNKRTKVQNTPIARSIHTEFEQMENRLSNLANKIDKLNNNTASFSQPPKNDPFNQNDMLSRFDELFIKLDNLNHQQSDYNNNVKYLEEDMQGQLNSISNSLSNKLNSDYSSEFDIMENRFSDLSERLDNSINIPKIDPQIAELESQVGGLNSQLTMLLSEQNKSQKPDTEITELKNSIAAINTRLDKTEERLSGVDRIEENMTKLISSVDDMRNNNQEIANAAAKTALETFSQAQEKTQNKPAPDTDAINKLIADKFSEFSSRNSENLQSSLEKVMSRLSKVEDGNAERFSHAKSTETLPPDRNRYKTEKKVNTQDFIQPGAEKTAAQPQDMPANKTAKSIAPEPIIADMLKTPNISTNKPLPPEATAQTTKTATNQTNTENKRKAPPDHTDIAMQSVPIGSEQAKERPVARPNDGTDFIAVARRAAQQTYNAENNSAKSDVKKSLFSRIKRTGKNLKTGTIKIPASSLGEKTDTKPPASKFSLSNLISKKKQTQDVIPVDIKPESSTGFLDDYPENIFNESLDNNIDIPAQNAGNELQVENNDEVSKLSWLKQQITPPVIIALVVLIIIITGAFVYSSLVRTDPIAQNAPVTNDTQPANSLTNVGGNARQILDEATLNLAPPSQNDEQGNFVPEEFSTLPTPDGQTRQPTVKQLETLNNANPLVTNSITSFKTKSYDNSLVTNKPLNSTNLKQRSSSAASKALPRISPNIVEMDKQLPPQIGPKLLRQNALAGNAAEQFEIANRYAMGDGVEVDLTKSFEWFLKAANNNLAPAQFSVGMMFENGKGVDINFAKAKQYYRRAAEQGNLMSIYRLAMMNAAPSNPSLKPDFEASLKWFNIAANAGLVDAQYNLAVLYEKGQGAKSDLVEAYKWYSLAQKEGDKQAASRAAIIKLKLSPAQIITAQNNIKQWTLNKLPSKANIPPSLSYLSNEPPADNQTIGQSKYVKSGVVATDILADKKSIKSAQNMLKTLGWDIGATDGIIGNKTRKAISEFQARQNLLVTGKVNDELIENLESATL